MTASRPPTPQAERRHSELERLTRIQEASDNCKEIARSVQALSHELHSSGLDYIGLVPTVRGFCRELATQHRVIVDFTTANIPNSLPRGISLCLFRVVQEALRNAVKHSGSRYFEVSLRGERETIELTISDKGAGFDTHIARSKGGLGLLSMQERVHQLKGTISVVSKVNCGTTITVKIPMGTEGKAQTA